MKLFVKILNVNEYRLAWRDDKSKEEGWYELEREPDPLLEYLEYDSKRDVIFIKTRPLEPCVETPLEKLEKHVAALEQKVEQLEQRLADMEARKTL